MPNVQALTYHVSSLKERQHDPVPASIEGDGAGEGERHEYDERRNAGHSPSLSCTEFVAKIVRRAPGVNWTSDLKVGTEENELGKRCFC